MAIIVNGYEHRTLAQPLYVDGKQVMEAYANGVKVYPDGYVTRLYGSHRLNANGSISWDGDGGDVFTHYGALAFFRVDLVSGTVPTVSEVAEYEYEVAFDGGAGLAIDYISVSYEGMVSYRYRGGSYRRSRWGGGFSARPPYPRSTRITEPFADPLFAGNAIWLDADVSGSGTVIRGFGGTFHDFYDHKPWGSEGGATADYQLPAPITLYQLPKTE